MIRASKRLATQLKPDARQQLQIQKLLERDFQEKLKLQGQKKVVEYEMLQTSVLKIVFIGVPLVLSIVGLYCLLKSLRFRMSVIFTSHQQFVPERITHLRIKKNDNSAEIAKVKREYYLGQLHYTFTTQLLRYELSSRGVCPVASQEVHRLFQCTGQVITPQMGLGSQQIQQRMNFFGANHHQVQMPGYLFYMVEILTEPLFLLQYCIFAVWIIRERFLMAGANMLFSVVVTSVNYFILYHNFAKVKQMAERTFDVRVLRNEQYATVANSQILPGDIFVIENEIPCDSVVISGGLLVNEVNFTGENLPILKYKMEDIGNLGNRDHWIYEGSQILSVRGQALAMAIHTGYASHRGRIIRKIIKHNVEEPLFTHHILIFFVLAYILAGMVYFSYITKLMSLPIREDTIVFLFFEIVSLAVPVGYVGVVNLLPGLSLLWLDRQGIYGKEPYKVYEVAQLESICFDKTGTLTQNSLQLGDVYLCQGECYSKITQKLQEFKLVFNLFSSCHMIKQISHQHFAGDAIDLKMFQRTRSTITPALSPHFLYQIIANNHALQILRVNQFQSKHMSMSVLVRENDTKHLFIFVKGSPQLIYRQAEPKPANWLQLTKELSFEGFRTIGMGYKLVTQQQQQYYRRAPRETFLQNLTALGLVSFVNLLKPDAATVVERLKVQVGVDVKMITGDNIYTAVQTAFKSGIIGPHQSIAICEEKHIIEHESLKTKVVVIERWGKGEFRQKEVTIDSFQEYVRRSDEKTVFAIENAFIREYIFQRDIIRKVKVFARVSPENKIEIIRGIKTSLHTQHESNSRLAKLLGNFSKKVCMVGDGANDLMAIKQADVGIGIRQSDGTFSADFVVSSLPQIEQLIRQGKAISKTAMETLLIYFLNTCLYIPLMLMSVRDLCTFSEQAMFYKNIGFSIFLPLLFGLTRPLPRNTRCSPQMNVLSLQHQSRIWCNIVIFTLGFCLSFEYYWRSDDVELVHRGWVSMRESFTTYSKSSTLCFKLIVAHCFCIIGNMYSGRPWKQPIHQNHVLLVWMAVNLVLSLVAWFWEESLGFLKLAPMKTKTSARVLTIMLVTSALSLMANNLIDKYYRSREGHIPSDQ